MLALNRHTRVVTRAKGRPSLGCMLRRRDWLRYHLAANLFPPLPSAYVDAAECAIDRCRSGRPKEQVELPNDTRLTAEDCVRVMHLRYFVELDSDE